LKIFFNIYGKKVSTLRPLQKATHEKYTKKRMAQSLPYMLLTAGLFYPL